MKERLDRVVLGRGLAQSRQRAREMILEGKVLVNRMPVTKAGSMVDASAEVLLRGAENPFVSRGGLKLKAAIDRFGIALGGRTAMDVGASTGGFTDCMLREGARRVYAVDVGYGQFDWRLRNDPRVVLMERTNIRGLERSAVPEEMEFAAIDVSFISLRLVAPKVREFMVSDGEAVALVKPQFEVGRANVGKGGIVRDEGKRQAALEGVRATLEGMGFGIIGLMESPVLGRKGNVEYLIYIRKREE